jgi:phage gpG-like protein
MISVKVRVTSNLSSIASRVKDRKVPNRQWATALFGWVIRNFKAQGALSGKPWLPLAESTRVRKERQGYSPLALIRTGNLRQSFAPFSDSNLAGVGAQASAGVDYARVHEEGSGRVPARPMLPEADKVTDIGVQVYGLYITKALKSPPKKMQVRR